MSIPPRADGDVLGVQPGFRLPRTVVLLGVGWGLLIVAVTAFLVVNGRRPVSSQIIGSVGFLVALVFCTVACIRVARRPSRARRGWVLMAVAMGIGALGQTSYVITAVTQSTSAPSPVVNTVAFLGYAVPSLAAVFAFPRPRDRLISRFRGVLDVLVITLGVVLISEATILRSVREGAVDPSPVENLLRYAYPISDIAICAVVLCVGIRQLAGDRLTWLFLGTGLVCVAVTDSTYVRLAAEGQQQLTSTALVAGWMLAPVLIGLATLIPMRSHADGGSGVTLAVRLVPYVPVLGTMVVFGVVSARGDQFMLVGGLLMLGVVTVRQVMIVYENVILTRDLEQKVETRTAALATLGSIVTSSSDAIVGVDSDGLVTAWNPAAEQLYGLPATDVLGKPPSFLSRIGRRVLAQQLENARRGDALGSFELDWKRPNGVTVPVAMTVSPVLDTLGVVQGISVSGQDITERRRSAAALEQAREEALESSRLKSEFLATMSHEIRTPMNGVIGLTTLLLETELDAGQRQYAEGVRGAGEALLSVINDILDFSKLEAGKVVLDPTDFGIRQLVDEVGALLAPAASAKGLELIAYCLPDVPESVFGDPGRIRQILLNLASNAVKFTTTGEVAVKVRSFRVDDVRVRVRFDITDTGIGIADRDQPRLFESFSQADASTTRRFGGTGLGLAISRRLVEVMGGEIGLTSEVGVGSTFWFEIPLKLGSPLVPTPVLSHDLLNDLRVLVVDDNATNRTVLEAQLRSWHMRPESVMDAATAFERLRARANDGHPYDLAALDMMMPDVDGFELARRIGADPLLHGMPLIMLTSAIQLSDETFRKAGIGQWLAKPVRSSELYDRLIRLMAPKEAELTARRRSQRQRPLVRPGSRGQVLVVEDNSLNQLVAEGIVSRLGFDVHAVSDGVEALHALEEHSYSVVLMDCHMPTMDGFTATREIRRREIGRSRIPIIAMTAGALPEDRERCLASGMDGYISKPVDLDALEGMLNEWAGAPVEPLARTEDAPQVDPPTEQEEVIDRSRLADLRELEAPDGSSLLELMVASFVSRGTNRLYALRRAGETADQRTMVEAAHELKGAAGTIGAVRVAQLCRELESAARKGDDPDLSLLDELEVELERANRALQAVDLQLS